VLNLNPLKWQLRRQIGLLGLMVLVTVILAAALAVSAHRHSEAARVADAERQIDRALGQLSENFYHFRASLLERKDSDPLAQDNDALLRKITSEALSAAPGVEGGFYSVKDARLLGYAFPTYEGTGPKTDIPPAEQPSIEALVKAAIAARAEAEKRVSAGADVILFRARPLVEDGQLTGAVWLMQRLHGPLSAYGIGLFLLLGVSCAIATGAWWIMRRLDRGVSGIEKGLKGMETNLDKAVPLPGIPELDRISTAINHLARAQIEIMERRAELEHRLRQSDRLAALGRLTAGLAHEIRNPLASINLKIHLARNSLAEPDRLTRAIEVIQTETDRVNRLVTRMLSLAKPSEPTLVATDLSAFIGERLDLWRGRAEDQGSELRLVATNSFFETVNLDRDSVGQILDNLVENALEALGDKGGSIVVEIKRAGPKEIIIAVSDTGPGVLPEVVEQIFEPFFTTRNQGTGLGLFLSAEIARRLGGRIEYRPCTLGGACFEVWLPC
jgi:hypothetical protein